jgi:hypothetical protein
MEESLFIRGFWASRQVRYPWAGGSYGTERLAYYRMLPEMGPPETTIWEYPRVDASWEVEFAELLADIRLGRQPTAGLHDARAALQIVERIYEVSGR